MFTRLRTLAIVGVAAGGPYIASETEFGRSAMSKLTGAVGTVSSSGDSVVTDSPGYANHALHEVEGLRQTESSQFRYHQKMASRLGAIPEDPQQAPVLVGPNVTDLREVLRFDITPEWVIGRFSRVSTVLADMRLEGLRVPVVTGTQADDLAGTLTYYFDQSHQLQRVTVHGFTGDPARMVQVLTTHYGLQAEPSLEAGVYTRRWNGQPIQFLRLSHAPVVYSNAVHQKYTVFLELNQPNLAFGISDEARQIVASDRGSGRW
ncbi:MAG: hypothetical protein MI861_17830 [Pirellulales bacterium]|nr:hypothetical protein [Pirellulales bacterium]